MTAEPPIDIDQDGLDDFSAGGSPTISFAFSIFRLCLAIFGVIANTVTGVVLTNKRLWSPTSLLLLSLVAYDAVFLLATIPVNVMSAFAGDNVEAFVVTFGIFYPLRFMAQTGSIYTTVTVTIERFLIVLRPLKARVFCTFGKIKKVVLGIFIFSVVFNIPRCFFYMLMTSFQQKQMFFNTTEHNSTAYSRTHDQSAIGSTTPTPLAEHTDALNASSPPMLYYDAKTSYYSWLYMRVYELYVSGVFFYLLPYALIPILNTQLLLAIKRRREETRRISVKNEHQLNYTKPTDLEDGLTMIVLGITVCFFICCLIPAIYNVTQIAEVPPTTMFSFFLLSASDTMLCINASTDFFFYCLLGRKFRNIFLHLFCPKRYLKKSRTMTSYTHSHRQTRGSDSYYHSV